MEKKILDKISSPQFTTLLKTRKKVNPTFCNPKNWAGKRIFLGGRK